MLLLRCIQRLKSQIGVFLFTFLLNFNKCVASPKIVFSTVVSPGPLLSAVFVANASQNTSNYPVMTTIVGVDFLQNENFYLCM